MKIKIYVINVPSHIKRRLAIEKEFAKNGLEFSFFKATDGNAIDEFWIKNNVSDERKKMYYSGEHFWLTRNQLACADSHRKLAKQLIDDEENDAYMVFEDDVMLVPDFFQSLEYGNLLNHKNLVLLAHSHKDKGDKQEQIKLQNGYSIYTFPKRGVMSASAYIYNKKGAKLIRDYQYPYIQAGADNWNLFIQNNIDHCGIVLPKPVMTGGFESTIRETSLIVKIFRKMVRVPIFKKLYMLRQRNNY